MSNSENQVRDIIEAWAKNTRKNKRDQILANHAAGVVIFDVLAPLQYKSAQEYRASWDEWQPETTGEFTFQLEDLKVTAGDSTAFGFGLLRCGGETPEGRKFEDLVRATFCLENSSTGWKIVHQHISKPV